MVSRLSSSHSERNISSNGLKTNDFLDRLQKHKDDSVVRKWREERFKDDSERRSLEISALEKEGQERGIARSKLQIYSEEHRRLQFELEGLVIERPKPPKDEFPSIVYFLYT